MAMKYVKSTIESLAFSTFFALIGCNTTPQVTVQNEDPIAAFIAQQEAMRSQQETASKEVAVESVVVKILATEQYLPKQDYNEVGQKVDYMSEPNPYLQQSGVISRASVRLFIDARRDFKAGRLNQAKKTLLDLTVQAPKLSGPRVMLAKIAEKDGDLKAALNQYREAVSINSSNVNAYIGLAKIQRQQGDYKQAQNTYEKALAVWRDFPEAHVNLAVLYDLYLNKPRLAQQHMEAYQFLTQAKNQKVSQWLAELQQRTGVMKSYIDNPPVVKSVVAAPVVAEPKGAQLQRVVAQGSGA